MLVPPWRRLCMAQCSICYHTPAKTTFFRKTCTDDNTPLTWKLKRCWTIKMEVYQSLRTVEVLMCHVIDFTSKEYVASCVPDWASLPYTSISSTSSVKQTRSTGIEQIWQGAHSQTDFKIYSTCPVGGGLDSLLFAWWFLLEFYSH